MKIINFIKNHLIWSILIFTLILYFINGISTGNPNPAGYFVIFLFLVALFAPLIRRTREKKQKQKENDYLAKKIAEEIQSKQ